MNILNIHSHHEVNISKFNKAELNEKIFSVKLLFTVIIVYKRCPSTYCVIQGRCFICSNWIFLFFTSNLESQPLSTQIHTYLLPYTEIDKYMYYNDMF